MELARISVGGRAVATVVVGAAIAGCGHYYHETEMPSSSATTSRTTTSSTASRTATSSAGSSAVTAPPPGPPTDYSPLLITASEIGGDMTTPQPPVLNPNNLPGAAQLFATPDDSRRIGDTIMIFADPAIAATGVANTKGNYAGKVSGTWQPVDVGSNGAMISGLSQDNSQAVTVLLFSEGKALVNLEFDSAPSDPIDPAVAIDIGRRQDDLIKNGLPS